MAERSRQYLKQEFQDGERPSGADFADFIDSFINLQEDGISKDNANIITFSNGIKITNTGSNNLTGALRFFGGRVQFHDGVDWRNIASGNQGAFTQVGESTAIAYSAGNVGIGNFTTPPTYRLEVPLSPNFAPASQVRFGNSVIFRGDVDSGFSPAALFAHFNFADASGYALAQDETGGVFLNCASGQDIQMRIGNGDDPVLALVPRTQDPDVTTTAGSVVIRARTSGSAVNERVLYVRGEACKTSSGNTFAVCSDERLKTNIQSFTDGLAKLLQVDPIHFEYNGKGGTIMGEKGIGVTAQAIREVFPYMVLDEEALEESSNSYLFLNSSAFTYIIINAVKELAQRLAILESKKTDRE